VVSSLQKLHSLIGDAIDQAVLLCYPTRPAPGKHVPKWFRFPDALEGIAHNRIYQIEDPDRYGPFCLDPVAEIIPKLRLEYCGAFRIAAHPTAFVLSHLRCLA
jgi:hypothetical protein